MIYNSQKKKNSIIPAILMSFPRTREVSKEVNLAFVKVLQLLNYQIDLYSAPDKDHISIEHDIGYADGIIPVLAQPEKPVLNGTRVE